MILCIREGGGGDPCVGPLWGTLAMWGDLCGETLAMWGTLEGAHIGDPCGDPCGGPLWGTLVGTLVGDPCGGTLALWGGRMRPCYLGET
jgi:hypothetical protein